MVILGHHIYYEMQSVNQTNSVKWLDDSNMLGGMSEVAVVPDSRYYPEYAWGLRKTMKNLGLAGTLA
jgi:hypothetical protein